MLSITGDEKGKVFNYLWYLQEKNEGWFKVGNKIISRRTGVPEYKIVKVLDELQNEKRIKLKKITSAPAVWSELGQHPYTKREIKVLG